MIMYTENCKKWIQAPSHIFPVSEDWGKKKTSRQTTLTVQINVMTNAMSQTWKEGRQGSKSMFRACCTEICRSISEFSVGPGRVGQGRAGKGQLAS